MQRSIGNLHYEQAATAFTDNYYNLIPHVISITDKIA